MLDLQPDHLAGAQAAAIAETEQHTGLEVAGDRQQALGLVRAHHQRDLLGLAQMIDLGGKIQSPQRHAEQEPQPGHDAVAIADTHAGLGQLQLEPADILRCGRVRRAPQERDEPLAAAEVASLRARTELARVHVLDHALAQRADGIHAHGNSCLGMRLATPRSSRQGTSPATNDLFPGDSAQADPTAATIAKRFSAMARTRSGETVRAMSEVGGIADALCSRWAFQVMTPSGHSRD